jgi:hypothetical protein
MAARRRIAAEKVVAERVVGQHHGVECAGSHQSAHVLGRAVRRAERRAKPAFPLLPLQELDHAVAAPHVLLEGLAVIDARNPEQVEALGAQSHTSGFELCLEVANRTASVRRHVRRVRGHDDLAARSGDRSGSQVLGRAVVGTRVDEVDAEFEAREQRVDRLALWQQAQLAGPEADSRDDQFTLAEPAVFHTAPGGRRLASPRGRTARERQWRPGGSMVERRPWRG